ncbi:Uncharacterized protein APZ42_001624 [Daphnia magna]|uniref:Uncharacterized protein n=1 Tax=Daphnia magna TaxID=35525 RepID=A0A164IUZ0_9CRUS|nr:Uncharacterized protein APZ42_001624 [Daphnia magna]
MSEKMKKKKKKGLTIEEASSVAQCNLGVQPICNDLLYSHSLICIIQQFESDVELTKLPQLTGRWL